MSKTIVILLSETRASELTFDSFKKNVIDELNADLCVCIGVKPDYDYLLMMNQMILVMRLNMLII